MYRFLLEIEGVVPLRMNALNEEAKKGIRNPDPSRKKNDEELKKGAMEKIYRDEKGRICVEAKALKACGRMGAGRVKVSRRTFATDFKGAVHFEQRMIPLLDKNGKQFKEPSGLHFEFCRRPPKRGVMQPDMWPYFDNWKLTATGMVVDDRISIESIKQAYVEAGLLFGLLDGRPDWGRFIVKKIEKLPGKS